MRPLRLIVVSLIAVVLLSGCVVRVVYNQLDWLALWYVQDYFDLDAAQEQQARALIGRTLAWHRRVELPKYAALSRRLASNADGAVSPAFVAARYDEIVLLWDELFRHASPEIAALLQSLSDRQVEDVFAKLAEENGEFAEDYSGVTLEERRAKQDKSILRAFRRFTGRLDAEQEALVRERTAAMHDLSADWLQRRADWQRAFRVLMVGRHTNPEFAAHLADLLLDPNQFDSPGYRELVVDNQRRAFAMVAAVISSLSPSQSERLQDHFATWATDFEALTLK